MATRLLRKDGALLMYWRSMQPCQPASSCAPFSHSRTRTYSNTRTDEDEACLATDGLELGELSAALGGGGEACPPAPSKTGVVHRDEPPSFWLNIMSGIFSPEHMSLPGSVGETRAAEASHRLTAARAKKDSRVKVLSPLPKLDFIAHNVAAAPTNYAQQKKAVSTLKRVVAEEEAALVEGPLLMCRAQACPKIMMRDVYSLLPEWRSQGGDVTALTLSQKTEHDMSGWSEAMEDERAELEERFVECAIKMVSSLRSKGYLADFIDPSSGRPYYGAYVNDTMFETDERYRHLGFTIEDLGCCKVLTHRVFGTKVFVGAVFTTAPLGSDALEAAVRAIGLVRDDASDH